MLQAMADQGSGGAYEISQRMTAMLGWGATTSFTEDWTWDQAAETYVQDEAMATKLRRSNPEVRACRMWLDGASCVAAQIGCGTTAFAVDAAMPWFSCVTIMAPGLAGMLMH